MPTFAIFLLGGMFYMSKSVPEISEIPFADADLVKRTKDEQITNPNFLGVTAQGDSISLIATTLVPIANKDSSAELFHPVSEIETQRGRVIKVSSRSGIFMKDIETVSMEGNVRITTSDGYKLKGSRATSLLDQSWAYLEGPIDGSWPTGALSANSLEMFRLNPEKPLIFHFKGDVKVTLRSED